MTSRVEQRCRRASSSKKENQPTTIGDRGRFINLYFDDIISSIKERTIDNLFDHWDGIFHQEKQSGVLTQLKELSLYNTSIENITFLSSMNRKEILFFLPMK